MNLDEVIKEAQRLLKVEPVKRLRDGGQKAVVEVTDKNGHKGALKVVHMEGKHAAFARERAKREVELLASISSQYVVKALSPLVEIGQPVIGVAWLEELLPGQDLSDMFTKQWTWKETRALLVCLAEGLSAFHAKGVVHRDLSEGNVRCTAPGMFKLIDPGLARHLAKSTMTGTFQPGTPGFMSPEHVNARPTPASDVFAAGILAYRALTGVLPVDTGTDLDEYAARLGRAEMKPIRTLRPDLDDDVVDFIARCLHRQPARRFLDGAEMLAGLKDVA